MAFKLYLEIALATDSLAYSIKPSFESSSAEFTSIAYDFLTQAFLVYEDEITESNAQVRAITSIVGTLLACRTFEKTDYEALITKTAQYSAKLLKKPDQCRMVCLCSRLFYAGGKDVSIMCCLSRIMFDLINLTLFLLRVIRVSTPTTIHSVSWSACSGVLKLQMHVAGNHHQTFNSLLKF